MLGSGGSLVTKGNLLRWGCCVGAATGPMRAWYGSDSLQHATCTGEGVHRLEINSPQSKGMLTTGF